MIARAKCAGKVAYRSRREADKKALAINIERRWFPGSCMKAYSCRYCSRAHLTTAEKRVDLIRVEKMRQRWLRKTGLKDSLENGGWARHGEDDEGGDASSVEC